MGILNLNSEVGSHRSHLRSSCPLASWEKPCASPTFWSDTSDTWGRDTRRSAKAMATQVLYFREVGKIDQIQNFERFWLRRSIGQMLFNPSAILRFPHCMDARQQISNSSCRQVEHDDDLRLPRASPLGQTQRCVGFCLWAICAKPMEAANLQHPQGPKSRRSIPGWWYCWYGWWQPEILHKNQLIGW